MGTLKGFPCPRPPTRHRPPLASPFGDFGTCTFPTTPARYARALALGLAKPRWCAASEARRLPTRLVADDDAAHVLLAGVKKCASRRDLVGPDLIVNRCHLAVAQPDPALLDQAAGDTL